MKALIIFSAITSIGLLSNGLSAQTNTKEKAKAENQLFIDVHQLEPGKVTYEGVQDAHAKDLAIQEKNGVQFIKYWVDEEKGLVYCLSSSPNSEAIRKTHEEAHGLVPNNVYAVTEGTEAPGQGDKTLFMDVHEVGAGKVTAKDVEAAHQKDLAVEDKHGVHFINYWVNEKDGVILCLSEAKDANAVVSTHKEAHGLVPAKVFKVKQGQ